ncbi:MAG: hypothetical protein KAS16_09025 [Thermoplasmata archaeon]|nr:hypothetical protein [Thermoplasmata archaeon]
MEEMEKDNKNLKLIVVIIILIIIISSLVYLLYDNEASGIIAMEAKEIADDIVQNQNITLPFKGVSATASMSNSYPMGRIDNSGRSSIWVFTYCKTSETTHDVELFEIYVFSNENAETVWANSTGAYFDVTPISNWIVDSDEAFEIAENNPGVKEFRSTHSGEFLSVFSLYWDEGNQREVWKLTWRHEGLVDNIDKITIFIDANTGGVI